MSNCDVSMMLHLNFDLELSKFEKQSCVKLFKFANVSYKVMTKKDNILYKFHNFE